MQWNLHKAILVNFSAETLQGGKECNDIFKMLQENKNLQP